MRIIQRREKNVASEGNPKIANNLFFSAALNSRDILVRQLCVIITQGQYCTTNNFTCCSGRSELQFNLQHLLTLVSIKRRSSLAHTISYSLSRVQSLLGNLLICNCSTLNPHVQTNCFMRLEPRFHSHLSDGK